jgi:hypothetical protein
MPLNNVNKYSEQCWLGRRARQARDIGYPLKLHFDYHSLLLVFFYPNIPPRSGIAFKRGVGKMNLFFTGLLGPEFLLVVALGQWSSARTSFKLCIMAF